MSASPNPYLSRVTITSGVRSGKPCIRDTRITVQEILRWLAAGASEKQILDDYPYLEPDDFKAVFAYAAQFPDARVSGL